jgi:hypothetical protein
MGRHHQINSGVNRLHERLKVHLPPSLARWNR